MLEFIANQLKKKGVNPEKAKISGLSIIRKIKAFPQDADLKDVINAFVLSDYRSVPIYSEGDLLNLTKLGMLKIMPKNILHGKRAEEIITSALFV